MSNKHFSIGKLKKTLSLALAFTLWVTMLCGNLQSAYAAENITTAPITDPVQQAQALGFDTTQGQRTYENGNPMNVSHPLGADVTYINRISQIGIISNSYLKLGSGVSNLPLTPDGIQTNHDLMNLNGVLDDKSLNAPKVSVAADFGGIKGFGQVNQGSTQVFVTAAIPESISNKQNVDLRLFISDNNGGKLVHSSFLIATIKKPVRYDDRSYSSREYPIDMVAGDFDHDKKDELAVAVGSSLFIIKINKDINPDTGTVSYDLPRSYDMGSANYGMYKLIRNDTLIPHIAENKGNAARNVIDLAAGDADSDGYTDLLICSGDTITETQENKKKIPDPNPAALYIYSGTTDLNHPTAKINLHLQSGNKNVPAKYIFTSASVSVGDAFNTGENVIIIGGRLNDKSLAITYLKYDGKGFGDMSSADYPIYPITNDVMKQMKSWLPGIDCAALDGRDMQEYVVFGNILLKYDGVSFVKYDVEHPNRRMAPKNTQVRYQYQPGRWDKDITDISVVAKDKESTYIISTIVGNFDGNLAGREQILMLHYNQNNQSYNKGHHVYLTWCGQDSESSMNIVTHLTKIGGGDGDPKNPNYPSVAAVDVLNTGITVEASPLLNTFTFSDPTVIAVLGAAPYYKELNEQSEKYSGTVGNAGTTYGTGNDKSSSSGGGISASAGVSFGFEDGLSIFGKKIIETELEVDIKKSFTQSWSSTTSVSTSQTFTNLTADDQVVAMVVPYDVFYYEIYAKDSEKLELIEVRVPYAPIMQSMSLNYYNQVTENMPSAPKIIPEVLNNHVVGDPRTYIVKKGRNPEALSNVINKDLSQASRKKTLYREGTYSKSLVATGIGEGLTAQEITVSEETEKAFDYSLETNTSLKINILGATAGRSEGVNTSVISSSAKSKSITSSGTVANVPEEYSNFAYQWCLAVYNYNLTTNDGKNTSECHVVNYLTQPIGGSFPPAPPQNLVLKNKSLTQNSAIITWNGVEGATEYYIYKSDSSDGKYTKVDTSPAIASGIANTSYNITGLSSGVQAYFKVSAVSGSKEGIPSVPIPILPVDVKSISVSSQPVLSYTEGDKLDLSNLSVTILYTDDLSIDVTHDKFAEKGVTTDIKNNTVMSSDNTAKKIKITYSNGKKTYTAQTEGLTVFYVQSISIIRQPQLRAGA